MRNGFTTLVNPATPVSAPAASDVVRGAIRELAEARQVYGQALTQGGDPLQIEESIGDLKRHLGAVYAHPSSSHEDRVAIARALGIPEPHDNDNNETEEV